MALLFVITYCVGLLSAFSLIIILYVKYKEKHYIPEAVENVLGVAVLALMALIGTWMITSYKHQIEEDLESAQLARCLRSKRSDGEYITEQQCWYFQDVMGGEYMEDYDDDSIEATQSYYR